MKKQKTELIVAAAAEDRISGLPDEILHRILRCLDRPKQAARTSALSSGWRALWRSHPFVDYNSDCDSGEKNAVTDDLVSFGAATIRRFYRDDRLRMMALNVSLRREHVASLPIIGFLLDLAAERKAEEVAVRGNDYLPLPLAAISNPSLEYLHLEKIMFSGGHRPLQLKSLRSLSLLEVEFEDGQLFANLIANSPLLETLKLDFVSNLTKLVLVCNTTASLNEVKISYCYDLEEVEIAASGLRTLLLKGIYKVAKFEVTAPQLSVFEFEPGDDDHQLGIGDLAHTISKLQSLKSLTLLGFQRSEKQLKFSSPNLEELTLQGPPGLKEIEIDAGPGFRKFSFTQDSLPGELKRCEIRNVVVTNGWEASFSIYKGVCDGDMDQWLVGLKNFIAGFPQFHTVEITCSSCAEIGFDKEVVDHNLHLTTIEHLKVAMGSLSTIDQMALLDGLFWACSPKLLTITFTYLPRGFSGDLLKYFSKLASEFEEKPCSWKHRLKDVKIVSVIETESHQLFGHSKWFGHVCFMLVWK